jgi:hypothetical protein
MSSWRKDELKKIADADDLPLIAYVPVKEVLVKFPVRVTTCPSKAVEVREVLSAVTVPVKAMVVNRLKQFEPSICSTPLTAESAWLMLPANLRGGFPGTVDAALNCQLPAT